MNRVELMEASITAFGGILRRAQADEQATMLAALFANFVEDLEPVDATDVVGDFANAVNRLRECSIVLVSASVADDITAAAEGIANSEAH